ncbi:MAG: toxin-antitoxin system YwqK family antitoxin [Desulfovibrionaceae bacterium]
MRINGISFLFIIFYLLQGCASHDKRYLEDFISYDEVEKKYYDIADNRPLNGVVVELYDSGEVELETKYRNGIKHGVSRRYYRDGACMIEVPHKNSVVHGVVKIYAEDGTLLEKIPYKGNYINGVAEYYSVKGIRTKTVTYTESERNGLFIQYYPDGKHICFSIIYEMGVPLAATLYLENSQTITGEELYEWIDSSDVVCAKSTGS